ncbi:hypothetical protein [Streptomyces formicae]|uniref:Phage protein n=1 Tax=Streptomyces formicae TaxID=1616117 RepID=A0ABY3WME0_9ACTN|nr:hypothetical protein [Streptomyces formicae]UNM13771.1 hypothetical protein J4032_21995 [Streptomyces formicae]
MRVKVLESASTYYNYGIVQLTKGDEVKGGFALFLLETGADVEPLDEDAKAWCPAGSEVEGPEDPYDPEGLDIGAKADAVLAWVGDDADRAAEALEAELVKDKPRSTLVKALEKLAEQD